jgi:hypothetical protein
MRLVAVATLVALGCHAGPAETLPDRRALVTDSLAYLAHRATVRAWHDQHDWCRRRVWASADEFVICDPHPYINLRTPPMYALARYDSADRLVAFAIFTPVPCRMYGHCDRIYGRTTYGPELDFVDHHSGPYEHLADRGRNVPPHDMELPIMQHRMFDALARELLRRFGTPTWQDPRRYGLTWSTRTSEIGLFVAGNGGWVVETHELIAATRPTDA